MRTRLFAASSALCILLSGTAGAFAQEKAAAPEQPTGKWLVQCNNQQNADKLSCQINQTQRMANTGARLLAVTILQNEAGGTDMVLVLPHGVALRDGVNYKIGDGVKRSGDITVADSNGSYAKIALGAEDIANLRKGKSMEVSAFVEGSNGLAFNVDLTGFARAYDLMVNANKL